MNKKRMTWKRAFLFSGLLTFTIVLLFHSTTYAMEEEEVIEILRKNSSLFESNSIGASVLRYIGWGITKGLAAIGTAAANLYDTCFGFVDFTKFKEVNSFIQEWKTVFIALVCLSLLFIGILLCIGWDKKPKILINLLIAVTVVTSSTYVINKLNSFISTDVRNGILGGEGGSSIVYNTVGANIHDLVYLDTTVGLQNLNKKGNGKKVYDNFDEQRFDAISINETVEPGDVSDAAEDIMANGIKTTFAENDKLMYDAIELYDGVAWTDLLNEYYYRYTVDWGVMWMELLSLIIIYLFMSYKVIRILYEIVIHRILAYLYAANLNNNQKILKIIDSMKDSYILLLMTTVMLKVYLIACRFITSWDISGLSKGLILLFLAFAVIDGPNLIQRLTGVDMGASDGMGKMISMFYGAKMAAGAASVASGVVRKGAGAVRKGAGTVKNAFQSGSGSAENPLPDGKEAATASNVAAANVNNDKSPDNQVNNPQNNNQDNQQNNYQDVAADMQENSNSGNNVRNQKEQNPDIGHKDNGQPGPVEHSNNNNQERAGTPAKQTKSAISSEQGKKDGGYRMDNVGQGLQSKKDALNGVMDKGGSIENNLNRMEQDIASEKNRNGSVTEERTNNPLGTEGNLLKDSGGRQNVKEIFDAQKGDIS